MKGNFAENESQICSRHPSVFSARKFNIVFDVHSTLVQEININIVFHLCPPNQGAQLIGAYALDTIHNEISKAWFVRHDLEGDVFYAIDNHTLFTPLKKIASERRGRHDGCPRGIDFLRGASNDGWYVTESLFFKCEKVKVFRTAMKKVKSLPMLFRRSGRSHAFDDGRNFPKIPTAVLSGFHYLISPYSLHLLSKNSQNLRRFPRRVDNLSQFCTTSLMV